MKKYIFYGYKKIFRQTIFSFIDNKKITNDIEQAKNFDGVVVILYEMFPNYDAHEICNQIILTRVNTNKKTKILMDTAFEELQVQKIQILLDQPFIRHLDTTADICVVYNNLEELRLKYSKNRCIEFPQILKKVTSISIDFYGLDAYVKCCLTNYNAVDTTLVKDRLNGVNLLIGKLKTRYSRFLTTYYFYKYGLLNSGVIGIIALPDDILSMMQSHPNYNDIDYYNEILKYLGPADHTDICMTDEGLTANDGWPLDHTIFKKSSLTYVCDTADQDKTFGSEPYIINEKFYRAIVNKHPFIIQANPRQLELIKSIGYQSFDSIIDESYNNYTDRDWQHVEPAVKAAKDLLEKIPNNVDKVQEIVDYNFNYFIQRFKMEYKMLIESIENFAK